MYWLNCFVEKIIIKRSEVGFMARFWYEKKDVRMANAMLLLR